SASPTYQSPTTPSNDDGGPPTGSDSNVTGPPAGFVGAGAVAGGAAPASEELPNKPRMMIARFMLDASLVARARLRWPGKDQERGSSSWRARRCAGRPP